MLTRGPSVMYFVGNHPVVYGKSVMRVYVAGRRVLVV